MILKFPGRLLAVPMAAALAAAGVGVGAAGSAQAVSASVVISEVYGGGGNTDATYTHDFVELYNLGSTSVDLAGWKVQYYSATGTSAQSTPLTGSLAPGTSYLVQLAKGAGGTTALPTPDATGSTALSASAGRVALVDDATVVDLVGYGSTAKESEGAPAPAPSSTTSVSRTSPCTDTDDNAADFTVGPPNPRNSAAGTQTCTVTPPEPPDTSEPETIAQIQGATHRSTYDGKAVNGVQGVVTAVGRNGFWMQSTAPDADVATSEGIFVFTSRAPSVVAGDAVTVAGTVTEFRSGGSGGNDNLSTTEITAPKITVGAGGQPLPAPVVLGVDRTAPPQTVELGNPLNVEYAEAAFRPAVDAIDFYESLEGMYVGLQDADVVGPTASFGEIPVVPGNLSPRSAVRSPRGGVVYSGYDHPNTMRVQLDDLLLPAGSMPEANVGDSIPGLTTGVVDYSFANFKLAVTAVPVVRSGGLQRETTRRQGRDELAVATFNVENLAPGNPATKYERLAAQVVRNLASPDVLALEEVQDDTGATNDGVVTSGVTVSRLVAAIVAAGGPRYDARWIDPQDGQDGGQPGGNIRNVILFRADRGVSFVDRPGGDATTAVQVQKVKGHPQLSVSPGRIDPTNPAWEDSRKPLVGQLRFRGEDVFLVTNHFASKGGDDPLFGRWQQPVRSSEVQRQLQAAAVRTFLDQLLAVDRKAKVVVLGDMNDFEFSSAVDTLVGSGRTSIIDLPRTLPANDRYTYVYEGNSQVLDHILISQGLAPKRAWWKPKAYSYDIVHTNAEFADQDSDHDPQVVRLDLGRGGGNAHGR